MSKLTAITTEAKKLYKTGKFKKWTDAIKAASKKLSGTHSDKKSHNVNIRVVSGYEGTMRKGNKTNVLYSRAIKGKPKQGVLFGAKLGAFFDTSVISEIDQLKKEYHKLAKKYHPDAGGTKEQFQQLQNEYDKLLNALLSGSKLTDKQQQNEIVIDKAIRDAIDAIIGLQDINIELIGKWVWVSGNTKPVRGVFKSAGFVPIKKAGVFYWVYKGIESSSRGGTPIEEIRAKYGVHKFDTKDKPKLNGIGRISSVNKRKLLAALKRLKTGVNKRPV